MIPRATYRLQFNKDFTFADAENIVPYLADLGISHVYASPILASRSGSTHGYDVVSPNEIDPELGGEDGFRSFVTLLHEHGMGLVVDIVPNHMGVGGDENEWWLDVLRHGQSSAYGGFFDIDWDPPEHRLKGKLLAPFLGKPYGEALADGDITLVRDRDHGWSARYFHHLLPIRPEDVPALEEAPEDALRRHDPSSPAGRDALHALLERQYFVLAWWRAAGDTINWRRFFDVIELATLRADRPEVFERTHRLVLRLYEEGLIDGLRVDHVDGLGDPAAYCRRLRHELAAREGARPPSRRQFAWLVVEKILAAGEALETSWETDGTTGYDFMNETSLLLHDEAGYAALAQDWARRTGRPARFVEEEQAARREIVERAFSAQLEAVVEPLHRIALADTVDRDRPRAALRRCLVHILAHFPRYRSYVGSTDVPPAGLEALAQAVEAARGDCFPADRAHLPRIAEWLGPIDDWAPDADLRRLAIRRFEQLCAPVAAKAVEDTAFYRHGPVLSRNDVGFDPGHGGGTIADWHDAMARRLMLPASMLASATHDHKRGEDVRARLAVLTEKPSAWISALDRWLPALHDWRARQQQSASVEPADDIMMLQMIVGAWPDRLTSRDDSGLSAFRERLAGWQRKALREAKLHSSWEEPNEAYEAAAGGTLSALLDSDTLLPLREDIEAFARSLMPAGFSNGLVQTVLKLCVPGVPDIYQGTEFVDLSLVDPDNRRPIDFAQRAAALSRPDVDPADRDSLKLSVIARLLAFRRQQPHLFGTGDYRPIEVQGAPAGRVLAFSRVHDDAALVVLGAIKLAGTLGDDGRVPAEAWKDALVTLPDGFSWSPILAPASATVQGTRVSVAHFLTDLPVAVLSGRRP